MHAYPAAHEQVNGKLMNSSLHKTLYTSWASRYLAAGYSIDNVALVLCVRS